LLPESAAPLTGVDVRVDVWQGIGAFIAVRREARDDAATEIAAVLAHDAARLKHHANRPVTTCWNALG